MTYDVVTFGETMLQLLPPHNMRIEQTNILEMHAAGSESNTAVGLARLGAKVNWFSRLPSTALGRLIANYIREQNVDVSDIIWTQTDRLGLYFVERGIAPRQTEVIYDRANSAMCAISPHDLPEFLFESGKSKLLHATGTTLAIGDSAAKTTLKAIQRAKEASWLVSFDVNYRSKLWSADEAKKGCEPCLNEADIIFIPLRDARLLFEYEESLSSDQVLEKLHQRYPHAVIVMSEGEAGSHSCSSNGTIYTRNAYHTQGQHRIGAGDAFSAGFLYCYLCLTQELDQALAWGNAAAAIKFTIPGDFPLFDKNQIETLINNNGNSKSFR